MNSDHTLLLKFTLNERQKQPFQLICSIDNEIRDEINIQISCFKPNPTTDLQE